MKDVLVVEMPKELFKQLQLSAKDNGRMMADEAVAWMQRYRRAVLGWGMTFPEIGKEDRPGRTVE